VELVDCFFILSLTSFSFRITSLVSRCSEFQFGFFFWNRALLMDPELALTLPFSSKTLESQQKHLQVLEEWEQRKRARQIAIPTDDKLIQLRLRELDEPIILFGEQAPERRERLREVLAKKGLVDAMPAVAKQQQLLQMQRQSGDQQSHELFYTEGSLALKNARIWIAKYSIVRAKHRIDREKERRKREESNDEAFILEEERQQKRIFDRLQKFAFTSSEIGDERPLSFCTFASDSEHLATAGWSGLCKIWTISGMRLEMVMSGHRERVTSIAFHPDAYTGQHSTSAVNLATSSFDQTVQLWSLEANAPRKRKNKETHRGEDHQHTKETNEKYSHRNENRNSEEKEDKMEIVIKPYPMELENGKSGQNRVEPVTVKPLIVLRGHTHRVNRVAFHPSGRFVGSVSCDQTWRFWDIESGGKELLEQEGHIASVRAIAFQSDGSLVSTGGDDQIARVWDLRSGKSIQVLRGHSKKILALDFSPNGFHIASGSEDNTIKIWDLRKKRMLYTIAAHSNLVSQVRFHAPTGDIIASSSFDGTCKLWSTLDWSPIKTLKAGESKVHCVDISLDFRHVITANYDRTWKVFSCEDSL